MILHNYPLSPYSEKIRAMFGYCDMDWTSCITSEAPPRGKLDLLTGGYSRIPVSQVGADIFCDTNIIASEIAALTNKPELSVAGLDSSKEKELRWIEKKLFFACINRAFSLSLLRRIAKEKGVVNLALFLKDRVEMGAKASIPMGSPRSAPRYISQAIQDFSALLNSNPFLGGVNPSLLDFAAYHCFWFLKEVGLKKDIDRSDLLISWYGRMKGFTQPAAHSLPLDAAVSDARDCTPRDIDDRYLQDYRIGSEITISPSDYRQIPVKGVLVGANEERWIVRLNSAETGDIHLHFPAYAMDVVLRAGENYWKPSKVA